MAMCPKCGSKSIDLPNELPRYVNDAKVRCSKCGQTYRMNMQGLTGPQVLDSLRKALQGATCR